MPEAPWGRCTRWLTCITVDPEQFDATREDVRLALETADIESRPLWKPMHLQPVFQGCEAVGGAVAEDLFARGLCLPSGTALSETGRRGDTEMGGHGDRETRRRGDTEIGGRRSALTAYADRKGNQKVRSRKIKSALRSTACIRVLFLKRDADKREKNDTQI